MPWVATPRRRPTCIRSLSTRPDRNTNLVELSRIGAECPDSRRHAVELQKISDDVRVLRAREFPGIVVGHRHSEVIEKVGGAAAVPHCLECVSAVGCGCVARTTEFLI